MSHHSRIHKQSEIDFAHSNIPIRIKCPQCNQEITGSNHVHVFKNLAGFWWHFKTEHGNISNSRFNTDDVREVAKAIAKALEWGMLA